MIKEYIRYLKDNPERYWFKARLYGWGWVPARLPGWIVLFIYLVVVLSLGIYVGVITEDGGELPVWFLPLIVIATAILIWITYKKGEKPRWMWGLPDKYKSR